MLAIRSTVRYIYFEVNTVYFIMTVGLALEKYCAVVCVLRLLMYLSNKKKMLAKENISIVNLYTKRSYV